MTWKESIRNILAGLGTVLNVFPNWDEEPPELPNQDWLDKELKRLDREYIELVKEANKRKK